VRSAGLGYYAAQQLGAAGKHHVIIGSRDLKKAEKAIETIVADTSYKNIADDFELIQLDVTDDSSISAAVQTVDKKHGKLDALLNNAGIALAQEGSGAALRDLYLQHYNANVFGAAVTSEAFLPLLRKGEKRLAFTSSGLGSLTEIIEKYGAAVSKAPCRFLARSTDFAVQYPVYSSTKSALNSVMVHFAKNLEAEGFVVSSADPGYCATNVRNFHDNDVLPHILTGECSSTTTTDSRTQETVPRHLSGVLLGLRRTCTWLLSMRLGSCRGETPVKASPRD
jgi:NAD(P)-dependent dehydrogenase (short-subunit alcohol dehydrogenase family)